MDNAPVIAIIPPLRLASVSTVLAPDAAVDNAARIQEMFDQVAAALKGAPAEVGPPVATYGVALEGMLATCGFVYDGVMPDGLQAVELPGGEAVCGVHLGAMDTIADSWNQLQQAVSEGGYTLAGPAREVYVNISSKNQADWVTELQQPISAA